MKKNAFLNVLLFTLPLLVVFVASSASGLLVYDGENTTQSTWFYLVETSPVGWCAALAGLLNYVLFALAVIRGFVKKSWCVKGIRNIACIAGSLVVIPNMFRVLMRCFVLSAIHYNAFRLSRCIKHQSTDMTETCRHLRRVLKFCLTTKNTITSSDYYFSNRIFITVYNLLFDFDKIVWCHQPFKSH